MTSLVLWQRRSSERVMSNEQRGGDVPGVCMHRGRGARSGGLECWTSAVEAEVWRTGQLVSKRMDVLVSRDFRVSKGAPPVENILQHHQRDGCMLCCSYLAVPGTLWT